jgi:hypothetical protein
VYGNFDGRLQELWKKSLDMIAETPLQSFRSIRAQIFSKSLGLRQPGQSNHSENRNAARPSREDHEEEAKMGCEGQDEILRSQNIIEFDAFPTVFGQKMRKATESGFIGIFEHLTG